MAENTPGRHELDPHWEMTQQHASDISDLKAGQARLEVGVQGLGNKIDTAIGGMNQLMARVNQPPDKPNLLGFVTTACVVGGLLGALAMSVISPIKADLIAISARQYDHFHNLIDEAREDGRNHQLLADTVKALDQLDRRNYDQHKVISNLTAEVAADGVATRAIGDYVKENHRTAIPIQDLQPNEDD